MRVLVMDTGRGIAADKVTMWRAHLGLQPTDQLCLVAWWPSSTPLPVDRHLVGGPVLRLGHEPVEAPVRAVALQALGEVAPPSTAGVREPQSTADEAVEEGFGGLSASELDEQLSEQEADPSQAAAADRQPDGSDEEAERHDGHPPPDADSEDAAARPGSPRPEVPAVTRPNDLSHLPAYDPRRVRQAVRWRRKRAQRRARRYASRQVRRVRGLGQEARHLPSSVVRRSLSGRKDAISWEFALMTTRSRTVNDLFSTADVVVPVDARSQRAAWLLARRHPGPEVIVTLPAAARALAARRRER